MRGQSAVGLDPGRHFPLLVVLLELQFEYVTTVKSQDDPRGCTLMPLGQVHDPQKDLREDGRTKSLW